jgi:carbamoyl-phosphate synthase small subunit
MLEDGRIFNGMAFGALGEAVGEVCFNTGMTGYQEILTDPSYCGQIVTMTYPHIGNYGVNADDVESSRIQVAGFVVKDGTEIPSNYRSEASLNEYLQSAKIVGIQGIDTRALTRHIRDRGSMNGIISSNDLDDISLKKKIAEIPTMAGLDLVPKVTCKELYSWPDSSKRQEYNVVAIDFGIKHNILRLLSHHGCKTTIVPATTTVDEIMSINPDGVFLSNGPGDPSAVTYGINTIKDILGKKPIFGICLGHQLLSLAIGGSTYKLKFGHRGINHPVQNIETSEVEITSHNHGFSVDPDSLPSTANITHWNLNDNTVEGLKCTDIPAFSVQYHPEAGPGPHDSRYLFNKFVTMMDYAKKN